MAVETILGTDGNDSILGTVGQDLILAGAGDDWIITVDGPDTIYGESGNDTVFAYSVGSQIFGGEGDDQITSSDHRSSQIATLDGGIGNDSIFAGDKFVNCDGGDGDDLVSINVFQGGTAAGGDGHDTLSLRFYDSDLQVSDEDVVAVLTGPKAGIKVGGSPLVQISGFEKLDIALGIGNDRVIAGEWADSLVLGAGANVAFAGGGDDLVSYRTGATNALNGGAGNDTLQVIQSDPRRSLVFSVTGSEATDQYGSTLRGFENFEISAGFARDFVELGSGNDIAHLGGQDDIARGRGGDDWLFGETGHDTLFGGAGADILVGGLGRDDMTGGTGADEFRFQSLDGSADMITDFQTALDVLAIARQAVGHLLPRGELSGARFHLDVASGTQAQCVYQAGPGAGEKQLIWDQNGSGAGGETLVAIFANGADLTAGSILIY